MTRYQTILLVSDASEHSKAAESTAFQLAKEHDARIVIVDTVRKPSFMAKFLGEAQGLIGAIIEEKSSRLQRMARHHKDDGLDIGIRVLVGKSSEQIARIALAEKADLVVRYLKGGDSQSPSHFGTTARNLMRVCPCPLLLVRKQVPADLKVMACVNVEHGFEENAAILEEAENLAGETKDLQAVYCWQFHGGETLRKHLDRNSFDRYQTEAEENYRSLFDDFLKEHDLASFSSGVHLETGDPIQILPLLCRFKAIDVAVMSSASQDHPLGRLLGSTIESVLDFLPCSLLVVKPKNFKSPLKPLELDAVES